MILVSCAASPAAWQPATADSGVPQFSLSDSTILQHFQKDHSSVDAPQSSNPRTGWTHLHFPVWEALVAPGPSKPQSEMVPAELAQLDSFLGIPDQSLEVGTAFHRLLPTAEKFPRPGQPRPVPVQLHWMLTGTIGFPRSDLEAFSPPWRKLPLPPASPAF